MRKIIMSVMLCALACVARAQATDYLITVRFPDAEGRTIYLRQQPLGGVATFIDSAVVANGEVVMRGRVAGVGEYQVDLGSPVGIHRVWIDADPITMVITNMADELGRSVKITGGADQALYQRFNDMAARSLVDNIRLGTEIRRSMADTVLTKELQSAYAANNDRFRAETAGLIAANPGSMVSAAILGNTTFGRTDEQIEELFSALSPEIKSSLFGMRVRESIELRVRTRAGAQAMPFTLPAPDGTQVRMNDYAGRWVLLDFWSSTCMPCLRAAPVLREVQAKYADKFTIIGISLDTRREPWIGAIANHDLSWVHVSSLSGWDCPVRAYYGVSQMPTMLLVDPSGKIVVPPDGTLTAENLDQTLSKLIE